METLRSQNAKKVADMRDRSYVRISDLLKNRGFSAEEGWNFLTNHYLAMIKEIRAKITEFSKFYQDRRPANRNIKEEIRKTTGSNSFNKLQVIIPYTRLLYA